MLAIEDLKDVFRIYVQSLLSQAVDVGFLQTVFDEKGNMMEL
jgi:hypothetical protein